MQIKSLLTDYLCHLKWFTWHKFIDFVKHCWEEYKSYRYMKWHNKMCKKANKRLMKILSNKKNQNEFKSTTGYVAINEYGKYTGNYKDWIEEYKGE